MSDSESSYATDAERSRTRSQTRTMSGTTDNSDFEFDKIHDTQLQYVMSLNGQTEKPMRKRLYTDNDMVVEMLKNK